MQGVDGECATLAQVHGVARRGPQTALLELADCGDSPQRDPPDALIAAAAAFMAANRGRGAVPPWLPTAAGA